MSVGLYLRGQQSQENQLAKDAMPCQTPQSPVRWGWRRVARAVTALRAQQHQRQAQSLCCLHG